MSLVTRLSSSPRLAVEVAERQPVELVLDVRTHPVDRPLDNIVEHVPLEEPEHGGAGVQGEHHQQDRRERRSRFPDRARHRPRSAGRRSVLTLEPGRLDRLLLGHALGEPAPDHPGEDHVGRLTQHLGTDGGECHAEQ